MGLFDNTESTDQDIWAYTTDEGEYMPLPKREDFYVYSSETEREFDQKAFDRAMAEWHRTRPFDYWW